MYEIFFLKKREKSKQKSALNEKVNGDLQGFRIK
jgi:hypothetical protein